MGALAGYKASVYITTTPSLAFTNMVLTDSGGLHTTYTTPIANASQRYWDMTQPLTVQTSPDGTTWTTSTAGTVQYIGGIVTFASALTGATPSVRVSGYYMPYSLALQAKSIDIQTQIDILDISTFATGAWKAKMAALGDSTYKLSQWWVDNFYLNALGGLMVISAYSGANANQRLEGLALMKSDSIKIAHNSAIEESIDLDSYGPIYAIAS